MGDWNSWEDGGRGGWETQKGSGGTSRNGHWSQGREDWERCQQGKGRADRLSDGRILLREELEKRIGGKFGDRYLENQAKEK